MTALRLKNLVKRFSDLQIIHGVDLTIQPREFTVFVGPSGCGKSTLLRMIAGLEEISDGDLYIGDQRMNDVPPAKRGIAMVFQSYALYPHMSVYKNLAFGLETAGMPKDEIATRVQKAAEILQIVPLLQRKPKALSGGQRQRVAIGRAIVREPQIFLFDEPLSNLDAELRVQMRVEIAKLHRELGVTSIYVTHDQVEAMTMADKIVVLRAGRIEQVGSPLDLYNRPANKFVAGFIGSPKMNFFKVEGTSEGSVTVAGAQIPLTGRLGTPETLGVRPEHLTLSGGVLLGAATVSLVEQLGGSSLIYANLSDGQAVTIQLEGQQTPAIGSSIQLHADPDLCHLFDKDGLTLRRV
ncbi:ABC transporter ATP-binding protein [Lacibacterium aquatile]|uniref:ABC transporter ATP-binding protein n=1 Tax=Lacibacterium aquatile TaxID=1168082 RepID=A0ABW5DVY6_9PROT